MQSGTNTRDAILTKIRNRRTDHDQRQARVHARLQDKPVGIIPQRGQVSAQDRIELFQAMAEQVHSQVSRVGTYQDVPQIITQYLRDHNLPSTLRLGHDRRLSNAKWDSQPNLTITKGPSDGDDLVGVSHASFGIAETGTLVMTSGKKNPTTLNFLPDYHIVLIAAKDIYGDMENVLNKIKSDDAIAMPRAVNMITGPSRSGDIEQKLLLGAHGPRALKIIIVG